MTRPVAHLYRARPVPRRMTRAERIDRWLLTHPVLQTVMGGLLFLTFVAACAWLLLSVPEAGF